MNRLTRSTCLGSAFLLLAIVASLPLAADEGKGTFHFAKVQVQLTDAIAYRQDGKDPAKPVTTVILADFKIDRPAVMEAIDSANALMEQVTKNQGGNFVIVTLVSPEQCGVWALLGESGKQIDLSSGFPAKTKTSSAARIAGDCSTNKPEKTAFGDAYDFQLSYDLPLMTIPKPSPVPAGGGEPGQVLLGLIKAIQASDWDGVRLHLRDQEVPKTAPADMKQYFHGLALNYPKTAVVVGGLIKGGRAQLEIQGTDNDGKKIKGDFFMKKIAGNWRVLDQNLYFAE